MRTRLAAKAAMLSSGGEEGKQIPTESLHGVSPKRPTMTWLTSCTAPEEPIPSPI